MSDKGPVDLAAMQASADLWSARGRNDAAEKLSACIDEIAALRGAAGKAHAAGVAEEKARSEAEIARLTAENERLVSAWRVLDRAEETRDPGVDPLPAIEQVRTMLAEVESRIAGGICTEVRRFELYAHPGGGFFDLRLRVDFILGG